MAFSNGVVQSGTCGLIFPQIPNKKIQFSPRAFFSERLQVPLERNVHRLHCASRWRPTTTNQRNRNPRVFLSKKILEMETGAVWKSFNSNWEIWLLFVVFSFKSPSYKVRPFVLRFALRWLENSWAKDNMFEFRGKNLIFESPVEGGF